MNLFFRPLTDQVTFTHEVEKDFSSFLISHGHPKIAEHCEKVGQEAARLAARFNQNPEQAKIAGYLHDISGVIPNGDRIEAALRLGIEVLPEEASFPMIIHQKLSRVMAEELFGVRNPSVLQAIECHTTLKKAPSEMDKILFVADKIVWDQEGVPPYRDDLLRQLNVSLDHAAFVYIRYLWDRKEQLRVVHPWLKDAYQDLKNRLESS